MPDQPTDYRSRTAILLVIIQLAALLTYDYWERIEQPYSVHTQPWPTWDPQLVQQQHVTIVVQINGKVRGQIDLAPGRSESDATTAAQGLERVQTHLAGKTVRKVVYVPDKLINFVVG